MPARPGSAAGKLSADWQAFDDTTHGLTIFYPPGWLFFDAAQELTLPEEMDGSARGKMMTLLMRLQATVQSDSFVGFGFALPQDPPDLLHINNVIVDIFPSKGPDIVRVRARGCRATAPACRDRYGQLRSGHQIAAP